MYGRVRSLRRLAAPFAAVSLLLAACGGDDDDDDGGAATTAAETPDATSAPTDAAATTAPAGEGDATGVDETSIKIGFITSLTGPYAPGFMRAADSAKARVAVANAAGGVNGRQIELIVADDASSPAGVLDAAKKLVEQDKVFAVITESGFFAAGFQYLADAGVPVVGGSYSGGEWGDPANTNMFADWGAYDPSFPTWTHHGEFYKSKGATKLGIVGFAGGGASEAASKAICASAEVAGLECAYQDFTTPPGGVDFAAQALAMKNAGVDAIYTPMVGPSAFGLLVALQQAGVELKASMIGAGYGQALLDSAEAKAAGQGASFPLQAQPIEIESDATKAMLDGLSTNMGWSGSVDWEVSQGWVSANLMLFGLEQAGANPTRESFIANLRKVTDYDAGGLAAGPIDFSTWNGTDIASAGGCIFVVTLVDDAFVPENGGEPFCGTMVPGSGQG
jgi:branched-chain amino acid transport system substrate-binding protein